MVPTRPECPPQFPVPARKRAIAYLRASTRRQYLSCSDQLAAIESYCAAHDLMIVNIFRDDGISGTLTRQRRAGWNDLLSLVESGRLAGGAVVVWSLDRWSRDFRAGLLAAWVVGDYDVELHATDSGRVDLGTVEGQLVSTLKLALAAQEARERGRRVRERKSMHLAAGYWPTKPPYGYRLEGPRGRGRLVPDSKEATIVSTMFRLYDDGDSPARIATLLAATGIVNRAGKRFAPSSVLRILSGWSYGGICKTTSGAVYHVACNTFIDRELWERCRTRAASKGGRRGRRPQYPLSGLVTCAECRAAMNVHTWTRSRGVAVRGYRCPSLGIGACSNRTIARIPRLEDAVVDWWRSITGNGNLQLWARDYVAQKHAAAVAATAGQDRLVAIRRKLEARERRLAKAVSTVGLSQAFADELELVRQREHTIDKRIAATFGVVLPLDVDAMVREVGEQAAAVESAWDLREWINEIVVRPDRVAVVRGFGRTGEITV